MSRIVYLHGFASGPSSHKAAWFRSRFLARGVSIEIPDLAAGDFDHLTITGQLSVLDRAANNQPVSLIGSSLGGYLAALYASRHPEVERLVLMAPAFNFIARWHERFGPVEMARWKQTGVLQVEHYGDRRTHALHYGLIEDGSLYEPYPNFPQPALIFHGRYDDVVPHEYSVAFARRHANVQLHLLPSGHDLLNALDEIWQKTQTFLDAAC